MQYVGKPDVVDKEWGQELIVANNTDYCGKIMLLNQRGVSSIHYHILKKETFYVQSGKIFVQRWDNDGTRLDVTLGAGDVLTIEAGTPHRFVGILKSRFIEFSLPDSISDTYRITQSRANLGCDRELIRSLHGVGGV